MFLLAVLCAAPVALSLPVTEVTVFSDRARVVREAPIILSGAKVVELPLLPDSVELDSIRLELSSGTVRLVSVGRGEVGDFAAGEAKELLQKLEKVDDRIEWVAREQGDELAALRMLARVRPQVPEAAPLRPPPKLSPRGWDASLQFVDQQSDRIRERLRAFQQRRIDLADERRQLAERAEAIGGARRERGVRVRATLSGEGGAALQLVYFVRGATWTPSYDLQYLPSEEKVLVQFGGLVVQTTGEDWPDAKLTLSTAVPGVLARLPKLLTWKIGDQERFVPLSRATGTPPPPGAAPFAPMPEAANTLKSEALRANLLARARSQPAAPEAEAKASGAELGEDEEQEEGTALGFASLGKGGGSASGLGGMAQRKVESFAARPRVPPPPPSPAPMMAMKSRPRPRAESMAATAMELDDAQESSSRQGLAMASGVPSPVGVGLAPPPSYVAATWPSNSPAALAGGAELSFTASRRASIASDGGARRVALFSEDWPVTTERVIWPAVAPEAYLVAQIENPSKRALPGGRAELFVGQDPSGTANLSLVSPGERFTLPLGLDRAVKPVRNVNQVLTETGVFSKDEVTRYTVSIEVENPYSHVLPLRIVDQVPLRGDKNTEVKLLSSEPRAALDGDKGELVWTLSVPASARQVVTFTYELKRPKGFRVHQ